jgi:8-oxo-dGTP diphosphatase
MTARPGRRAHPRACRGARHPVEVPCLAPLTFASHAYDEFHLLMPLYICRKWDGFVEAREAQALKWVRPRDLRNYPMPPADAPLIPPLIDLLG